MFVFALTHRFCQENKPRVTKTADKSIALCQTPVCPVHNALKIVSGLIQVLCQANERHRYKVTPSLIGWA